MQKSNYFSENSEILFHIDNRVDFGRLYELTDKTTKETLGVANVEEYKALWHDVLSTMGEIAGTSIAPSALDVEREEISLLESGEVKLPESITKNMNVLIEGGFNAMSVDVKYGGLGCPSVFDMVAMEMINRACPSTALNACWWGSISHVIELYGSEELKNEYCQKITNEGWSGNMALTEADAGSDLGALKTYAEKQSDGSYKIYGSKRFISNGNGEISLVLSRQSKDSSGLKSLSLFLCPRKIDDELNYKISKIEEKLGLHGSATCELNFDGSVAYLLGEEGHGFRYMLTLMNEARIGVAYQSIGLLESILQLGRSYASQRESWGKSLDKHSLINEMISDLEADLVGSRSLAYKAASEFTLYKMMENKLLDESLQQSEKDEIKKEVSRLKRRVRKWTPLLKYFTSERAVHHARNCLQIHGGYGYTTEYEAERLLRESLIYPIYEGTSQIQALMCVKDTLKEVVRRPTEFIENSIAIRLQGLTTVNPLRKSRLRLRKSVNSAILTLILKMVKNNMSDSVDEMSSGEVLSYIKTFGGMLKSLDDFSLPMQHAERICLLKCYEQIANAMCQDVEKDPSREAIAERFMLKAYAHSKQLLCEIEEMPVFVETQD